MSDKDAIEAAYLEEVRNLYKVLLSSLAGGSTETAILYAKGRFRAGVMLAREARDLALAGLT